MKSLQYFFVFIVIFTVNVAFAAMPKISITTEHWPPYNYQQADGTISGSATEKIRQIFDTAEIDYTIKLYPWARAYHLTANEQNTAIYSIIRSPNREKQFQWVCPLFEQEQLYFVTLAKRHDVVLQQLSDAKNYAISTTRDEFDHEFLLHNGFIEKQHFNLTADDLTNIRKLLMGRTDLIVSTKATLKRHMTQLGSSLKQVKFLIPLTDNHKHPICLALGLKTPKAVTQKLQKALNNINLKTQSTH